MGNLAGKTCLVTGATSGIGKEIALGLARIGADVVLVGRSKDKCESTLDEIKTKTDPEGRNRIYYLVADLSSQASIRQLVVNYSKIINRLDILINNAGVFVSKRTMTIDGIEYTFAVNHLAPFLLTNLLIDMLKESTSSRIITTSSIAHKGSLIDFEDIQFEKRHYNGIKAYSQSKLANILFTKELSTRLEGTGVTANCFHPGVVRTNLVQNNNPWYYRLIWTSARSFFLSPEKGADTAIFLASSSSVDGISGRYFTKREQDRPSPEAEDREAAIKLWNISKQLTGYEERKDKPIG